MNTVEQINQALYGHNSAFTPEEQVAMKRGYTIAERKAISGKLFGRYPQAISDEHARKMDALNFGDPSPYIREMRSIHEPW